MTLSTGGGRGTGRPPRLLQETPSCTAEELNKKRKGNGNGSVTQDSNCLGKLITERAGRARKGGRCGLQVGSRKRPGGSVERDGHHININDYKKKNIPKMAVEMDRVRKGSYDVCQGRTEWTTYFGPFLILDLDVILILDATRQVEADGASEMARNRLKRRPATMSGGRKRRSRDRRGTGPISGRAKTALSRDSTGKNRRHHLDLLRTVAVRDDDVDGGGTSPSPQRDGNVVVRGRRGRQHSGKSSDWTPSSISGKLARVAKAAAGGREGGRVSPLPSLFSASLTDDGWRNFATQASTAESRGYTTK